MPTPILVGRRRPSRRTRTGAISCVNTRERRAWRSSCRSACRPEHVSLRVGRDARTSPRYILSASFRKFGTESNGISGTASCAPPNCCCAEIACPAVRIKQRDERKCEYAFHGPPLPRCRCGRGLVACCGCRMIFWHAPRGDLGDHSSFSLRQFQAVDRAELLQLLAGLPNLPTTSRRALFSVDLAGDGRARPPGCCPG